MTKTTVDVVCETFREATLDDCAKACKNASRSKLDQLSDSLDAFYAQSPTRPPDADLHYPGGWTASFWQFGQGGGQKSLDPLLYYPRVAFHDPLAEYFYEGHHKFRDFLPVEFCLEQFATGAGISQWLPLTEASGLEPYSYARQRQDIDTCRRAVAERIQILAPLEHLIYSGTIHLIPELQILEKSQNQIFTAMRYDMRDDGVMRVFKDDFGSPKHAPTQRNNLRGMAMSVPGQAPTRSTAPYAYQSFLYYLQKVLVISERTGARYAPDSAGDKALYVAKLRRELDAYTVDASFLNVLTSLDLPGFPLDAKMAVEIRANHEEFEDWRSSLRNIHKQLSFATSEAGIRQQVEDALMPEVHKIQRMSKTPLGRALSAENIVPFGIEALFWKINGGVVPPGLVTATGLAARAFFGGKPPEQQGVLAILATKRRRK